MKREQLAQEAAEKEKAEKAMKLKESFGDATGQWEKDKVAMQNIAVQDKKKDAAAAATKDEGNAEMPGGKVVEKVAA
jgi:mannan polymerase II complex ANP1 subunit